MRLSNRKLFQVASTAAMVALIGVALVPWMSGRTTEAKGGLTMVEFDVAEDGSRFVFDETPVHDDGLPAYGGEFVTQGYLYPAGTLTCEDGACNGVNPDGSPEFPDKVLGTWTCYGVHIGDGAHTVTGPWVITTQMFDFGEAPGETSIITNGIELADLDVPFQRAIIGATGLRAPRPSEQTQVFLGFNESFGVALRVAFTAKP